MSIQKNVVASLLSIMFSASAFATPEEHITPSVDHHQHLFSEKIVKLIDTPGFETITANDLIPLLDSAGIQKALLLSTGYLFAKPGRNVEDVYEKVKAENNWTAAQAALYPSRLKAMCGVNPLAPWAIAELERCSSTPGFARGVKLHLGNSDVQLDNSEHLAQMKHFFATANKLGMALVMHTRASISKKRPYGPEQARIMLEQLFPMAPDVVIHIAHLAGSGPGYNDPPAHSVMAVLADALQKRDPRVRNVWIDISTSADRGISPEHAQMMAQRIRQIGVDKVLYGSDGATAMMQKPSEAWKSFRRLPLTEAEFKQIASNVAPYMR